MEQREKSVGADVSAMPELTRDVSRDVRDGTDVPERHRARTAVAVDTSVNTRAAETTAARAREKGSRERDTDSRERERDKDKDKKSSVRKNRLRETRIEKMMSKAELARRANLSVLTIDRVEKGLGCRMDTKRKILEALGMSLADRVRVFGEEE
jgi:DNA-binding XRE family transcriptional regulator